MQTLDQLIEDALQLPSEQQETLIRVLRNRQSESRRAEIAADAQESLADFRAGKLRPRSDDEVIKSLGNLEEVCDRATQEPEGVAIMHDNRSYVLVTQEERESTLETAMLLQIPNILEQVSSARKEYLAGETLTMEEIFG